MIAARFYFAVSLLVIPFNTLHAESASSAIRWQEFSEDIFKRAAREKKLILMDVEAVWCHWCHVMDRETYSDPEVQRLIAKNFIAIRVDQDARPDISTRYQDYGWPATIVLSADGTDLVKRRGYIRLQSMKEMLSEVARNPVPHSDERKDATEQEQLIGAQDGTLSAELATKLVTNHERFFDLERGGLDFSHRYINPDSIEYLLNESARGNTGYEIFARKTLTGALKLIDPTWGGAYQYSTDRDWDHAHFEKIVPTQALNIRSYALGYIQLGDRAYLTAAQAVHAYLKRFLTSPEGAFYTSQDADVIRGVHSEDYFALDDEHRRKQGIPQVDTHRYSYENGLLISALVDLYAVTGDGDVVNDAKRAANWIITNRSLPGGGFRHDERDAGGPYLRDSLAMAQGLLSLYSATGDRSLLKQSTEAAHFIIKTFSHPTQLGLISYAMRKGLVLKPPLLQEENIPAARFFNLLSHYTGDPKFKEAAARTLKWLVQPKVALQSSTEVGILIANREIRTSPVHLTIVGHKDEQGSKELLAAALRVPGAYKRIDWWDKREGPLVNPDVQYPDLSKPAAFVCTASRCSLPIFAPDGIAKILSARVTSDPAAY